MRILKCCTLLLLLVGCTGCWSKIELDEWVFVYGLFIDAGDVPGTLKVTISTPLPNHLNNGQIAGGNSPDEKSYSTITKTAQNIPEALQKIQADMTRRLNLSEIRVILIGKKYAMQGIGDLLEWIKRESSVSMGAFILATDSVKEVSRLTPVYEQIPTQILVSFASKRHMVDTNAKECLISNASGFGFPLTFLTTSHIPSEEQPNQNMNWTGINGVMLFNREKMKGILGVEEGRALAWAYGRLKNPVYSIAWDQGKSQASVFFTKTSSKYKVELQKGRPVFTIYLKGRASVSRLQQNKIQDSTQLSELIIDNLNERIGSDLERAMEATRQASADVLKLGQLLEWKYPAYWKENSKKWEQIYHRDAIINIATDFKINDFGKQVPES